MKAHQYDLLSIPNRGASVVVHSLVCALKDLFMKIAKRHLLQLIKKLQLPFKPKDAIEIMAEYDSGIPENIEREISFIQFSEAMIKLIIRYKENVVVEKNDKMVPLKLESEGQLTAVQSGVTMSKTDVPASKVSSENTVSDVKCDSGASTRASGSLLQVGFELIDLSLAIGGTTLDCIIWSLVNTH